MTGDLTVWMLCRKNVVTGLITLLGWWVLRPSFKEMEKVLPKTLNYDVQDLAVLQVGGILKGYDEFGFHMTYYLHEVKEGTVVI